MKPYDYLIVGSGITGAVFAAEAARRGKRCLVLEKRNHIGGNVYDEEQGGILVQRYGAHIFHTSRKDIWDYLQQFCDFRPFINSPMANFKGELYNLPFNMNTFSRLWGIVTPAQAKERIEAERLKLDREPQNLEEQALCLVGPTIYQKLIKGYTEKQWGRPCRELPPFILRRIPVRFTYDNNYFNDPYQGIPSKGYTSMIRRMLSGCEVKTGEDYLEDKKGFDALARKVIYTGMIDRYFSYSLGPLEYRSLRFEDAVLEEDNFQGVAVMNYTDSDTPFTRIIEHKHFLAGTQRGTVITREYPMEWTPGTEPYYPVNSDKNQRLYERYRELSGKEQAVLFCGRLAEYRYYNMDGAVAAALKAAKKELSS